jgi:acid phosphatase type 7
VSRGLLLGIAALVLLGACSPGDPPPVAPADAATTPLTSPSPSSTPSASPTVTASPSTSPSASHGTSSKAKPSPSSPSRSQTPETTVRIAAAGDIACDPSSGDFKAGLGTADHCRQKATSDLLLRLKSQGGLAAVLPLGDTQYESGTLTAFRGSYRPSWGRLKSITRPAIGNHEDQSDGVGYFQYFGGQAGPSGRGYYSYDVGSWHMIALNSNCSSAGGCDATSRQGRWLADDLAGHHNRCTLAYYHHPRWSDGPHGDTQEVAPLVKRLYTAGADVILNGHDHDYQRFPPRSPTGSRDDARGIRQFVVGTGGKEHYHLGSLTPGTVSNDNTFGVLLMTLGPKGYSWRFVPESGKTFTDSGRASCH